MRAAWAALSLLLLPALGRRGLPMATAGTPGTPLGTSPGTPLGTAPGTPLGTAPGTAPGTAGTPPGTTGTPLGTSGTSGTPPGTAPGDACGSTGNGTARGDTRGDTGSDTGGDPPYVPGSVSAAFVTCPNLSVATELARALVQQRLAACVNIVPGVTSVYTWQGKLEEDSEVLLMIKTRSSRVPALTQFIRSQHPYEVPEVVALPVAQGNPPYLRWVGDAVPP